VGGSHDIDSEDPLELFDSWLKQAQESEPNDPNAAALATSTTDGVPSVPMIQSLLRFLG
jgi:pyridoxamine 5'-phosphate oxidase